MKKIIVKILIGLAVLAIIAALAVHFLLDGAIKTAVETIGPKLTKVEVKLASANLSIFSGSGGIKGLVVGNPDGFKTPSAISVGTASLAVQPGSIFSDKIIIRSIIVEAPEITLEGNLKGSNLEKLQENLQAAVGGDKSAGAPKEQKPGKKLQVDEFVITGGKVHVSFVGLAGKTATVPLPEIRLKDLGKGPEGITGTELTSQVLSEVLNGSLKASEGAVADLGKQAAGLGKDLGKSAEDAAGKVTQGIGNLFKKDK